MTKYLGDLAEDQTVTFAFNTHVSGTPTTLGGTPELSVYKTSNATQVTTGVTLTVDYDSVTGLNHVAIVTTDAFYATANDYRVVITTGTVGGNSVVGTVVAEFSIQNRNIRANVVEVNGVAAEAVEDGEQLQSTTIATLASQTSFTLTAGSADDDAYNGCMAVFIDQSTTAQRARCTISDYTGATKTITLAAAPEFTIATGDTVKIIAVPKQLSGHVPQTADHTASVAAILADTGTDGVVVNDFTTAAKALLQTEANDAIVANNLDHLMLSAVDTNFATTVHLNSVIGHLADAGTTATFDRTTDSLEAADDDRLVFESSLNAIIDAVVTSGVLVNDFTTAAKALLQTEATDALNAYDPPTNAEMEARTIVAANYATSAAQTTAQNDLTAILEDTGTTIPAQITALNNISTANVTTATTTAITTALAEGYRGANATGSLRDLLYEILAILTQADISSTTLTTRKLDGTTVAKTYTLNNATTPTSITETT